MSTAYRIWLHPGKHPVWGNVKTLKHRNHAPDTLDILVQGDGSDFERLAREQPEIFIMFERLWPDSPEFPFAGG